MVGWPHGCFRVLRHESDNAVIMKFIIRVLDIIQ